jgi:hypothetical protein
MRSPDGSLSSGFSAADKILSKMGEGELLSRLLLYASALRKSQSLTGADVLFLNQVSLP